MAFEHIHYGGKIRVREIGRMVGRETGLYIKKRCGGSMAEMVEGQYRMQGCRRWCMCVGGEF